MGHGTTEMAFDKLGWGLGLYMAAMAIPIHVDMRTFSTCLLPGRCKLRRGVGGEEKVGGEGGSLLQLNGSTELLERWAGFS